MEVLDISILYITVKAIVRYSGEPENLKRGN